ANLLPNSFFCLRDGFHLRQGDVIGIEEALDVNWLSAFLSERLTGCEYARPFDLAIFNAAADKISVLEHRSDIKDCGESPACEHRFKMCSDLVRRVCLCMNQPRRKNMHMAVPETGSHDEALAVDYGCAAWDFDLGAWTYR